VSTGEFIGVRTMALWRRAQPVITTTPAGVHIGTEVFAVVGTNERFAIQRLFLQTQRPLIAAFLFYASILCVSSGSVHQ
jgi:hypothetical protein